MDYCCLPTEGNGDQGILRPTIMAGHPSTMLNEMGPFPCGPRHEQRLQ